MPCLDVENSEAPAEAGVIYLEGVVLSCAVHGHIGGALLWHLP